MRRESVNDSLVRSLEDELAAARAENRSLTTQLVEAESLHQQQCTPPPPAFREHELMLRILRAELEMAERPSRRLHQTA